MLLFEEMGEDSTQAPPFQQGQGERATFSNLSTKTACCCLAWLTYSINGLLKGPSAQEEKNTNTPLSQPSSTEKRRDYMSMTAHEKHVF